MQANLSSPDLYRGEPEVQGWWGTCPGSQSKQMTAGVPMPRLGKLLPGILAAFRASSKGQQPGKGWWGLGHHRCPACSLTAISPSLSVFILFAAEDPRLRPAGPPLSAQPSHLCSTRLQGHFLGGFLVHPWCRSFSGVGPSAASGPPTPAPEPGSPTLS